LLTRAIVKNIIDVSNPWHLVLSKVHSISIMQIMLIIFKVDCIIFSHSRLQIFKITISIDYSINSVEISIVVSVWINRKLASVPKDIAPRGKFVLSLNFVSKGHALLKLRLHNNVRILFVVSHYLSLAIPLFCSVGDEPYRLSECHLSIFEKYALKIVQD